MPKELKKYELAASTRPGGNKVLATTVAVLGKDGSAYYCYIRFSPTLIEAVGKKLPRGISEHDPAYLYVDLQRLQVWAVYMRDNKGVRMWDLSGVVEVPWLKRLFRAKLKNGNTDPQKPPRDSSSPAAPGRPGGLTRRKRRNQGVH